MRRTERIFVDEPARLHPNDWSSLEVQLLDCSSEGFRVRCEARVRTGDLVTLEVPGIGPARAQISWRRGEELGARFLKPIPLEADRLRAPSEPQRLARLLVQRAAAHRAACRDEEALLRRRILEALPIRRN